ncbi:MAG TPA: hypothetical protein VFN95_17920, partial [Flavitalea sp.]|nr:hypothetical protein [Flavitalea sp.]
SSSEPRWWSTAAILCRDVLRQPHIAFLIKTGPETDFKSALSPATKEGFEKLWFSLAGKLF